METKLKASEMENFRIRCGFSSGIGRERAGGLAVFWADDLKIDIQSYSPNHIHGYCEDDDGGTPGLFYLLFLGILVVFMVTPLIT